MRARHCGHWLEPHVTDGCSIHALGARKYHHKLRPIQLEFADRIAEVEAVGFYHGGDVLYRLVGIPGTWHERCLRPWSEP
jgi:hypothetical protein